jgi:predicted phage terminase large subunit-like protein
MPAPHQLALNFYTAHEHQLTAGAKLLWPEVEPLYALMAMRAESGSAIFEREKQCIPMNPEQCEWPEAYFAGHIWFEQWPNDLPIRVIALDPSKGTDARHGDYSAFVMLAVASDNLLYVDANLARRPTPQIVTDGVELIKHFKPQLFGIEANQFQSLLGPNFAAELHRQGVLGISPCALENHLAKQVRIRTLGPLLANHKFRFKSNSPGARMLVQQLQEFPLAKHDDAPDALEMALRLAENLLRPQPTDTLGNNIFAKPNHHPP